MDINSLLALPDRYAAYMELVQLIRRCTPQERTAFYEGWDFGADWEYPSPWGVARPERGYSSYDRAFALLVSYLLSFEGDLRDLLVGFAVLYHGARLAGLDPVGLFHAVSSLRDCEASHAMRAFADQAEGDKEMEALGLEAIAVGGGYEVRIMPQYY